MKRLPERTRVLVLCASLAAMVPSAALLAPEPAAGQAFRSPYGYDPYDDYPPRPPVGPGPAFHPPALRGFVASVLARRGFRLVGPVRDEGDGLIASGVDASGRRMKFLIDAYEGQVLRSWPIGPADPYGEPGPSRAYAPRDFPESEYFRPPANRWNEEPGAYEAPRDQMRSQRVGRPPEKPPAEPHRADSAHLVAPHAPPPQRTKAPSETTKAPALVAAPPPKPTYAPPPASGKPQPALGLPASTPAPSPPSGSDARREENLAKSQPKQSPLPGIENEATPKENIAR